jgi:hypothetical protein
VIINLQATKHDKRAEASGGLVIHARADDVMRRLFAVLAMPLPQYVRRDALMVSHKLHTPKSRPSGSNGESACGCAFSVSVHSTHGPLAAMPLVKTVEFRFKVSSAT